MRWRTGSADSQPTPEENNDTVESSTAASGALPNLEDDEPDNISHGDQQSHFEDGVTERGHLGMSPSPGGLTSSANHITDNDALDDSSQNVKQKPPDESKSADGSLEPTNRLNDKPASEAVAVIENEDDDPGLDHAQPPDKAAEAQTTAWKPQNQQSTCEFTHTIVNYSQKRESGCKKAEYSATTVDEFGNRWRLIVYVNGNGRASNHHLSLFLQVRVSELIMSLVVVQKCSQLSLVYVNGKGCGRG